MNRIKMKTDIVYNENLQKDIKIIHIADIHFNINTNIRMLQNVSNKINLEKANYVIVTGDIVDEAKIIYNKEKINELITFFKTIARDNKVIISLGNHDIYNCSDTFFDTLDKIDNICVLDNKEYSDEFIYVCGFTLPKNYYYNKSRDESIEVFLNYLDNYSKLVNKLPSNKVKIALIHSPIKLVNMDILNKLIGYDVILCGHTHDGLVPDCLKFLFRGNSGIVSPYRKIFPKIAKGKIVKEINNHVITIIINGGITKLSLKSAKILSKLNIIFNIGINRIIITKK